MPEIRQLIRHFHQVASEGTPEEALAAFYTYESQVPRIAQEKERGLREIYGADDKTLRLLHAACDSDVYHCGRWRKQLEKRIAAHPEAADRALDAAENAARMLWKALDGIEARGPRWRSHSSEIARHRNRAKDSIESLAHAFLERSLAFG